MKTPSYPIHSPSFPRTHPNFHSATIFTESFTPPQNGNPPYSQIYSILRPLNPRSPPTPYASYTTSTRSPAISRDLTRLTRPHTISDHHLPQSPANLRAISLSRTFNYHPTSPIVIPKTSVTSVTKLTDDTSLPQHHHTAHHHHIHPFFRIIITNPNVYTTSPLLHFSASCGTLLPKCLLISTFIHQL